jgi:RNA polymerase sigma factor (sigma-70 family)
MEMGMRLILRTQSDERLADLARCGHDAAFEEIVRRYDAPIGRYCDRLAGPRAEEAAQEAFVSAWSALRRGTEVRELRPWLYRIAHRAALHSLGGSRNLMPLEAAADVAGADPDSRVAAQQALAAVAALPEPQRGALALVAGGYGPEEVGRALGMTGAAARQLVCRARAAVRAAATALTPWPLAIRIASAAGTAPELAGSVGSAGVAAVVVKVAAVVVVGGSALGAGKAIVDPGPSTAIERAAHNSPAASGTTTTPPRAAAPAALVVAVAQSTALVRGLVTGRGGSAPGQSGRGTLAHPGGNGSGSWSDPGAAGAAGPAPGGGSADGSGDPSQVGASAGDTSPAADPSAQDPSAQSGDPSADGSAPADPSAGSSDPTVTDTSGDPAATDPAAADTAPAPPDPTAPAP